VYEPLEAFAPALRRLWRAQSSQECGDHAPVEVERLEAWRRVIAGPDAVAPVRESRDARLLERDGEVFACPLQLRERWMAGIRAAGETLPPIVVAVAFGQSLAEEQVTQRSARLHTLVAPWSLPLEWLVLVGPREREDGRFLVPMGKARTRVVRASRVLNDRLGESGLSEEVEEVARWLGDFHPRSWVELDDGPVSGLVGADEAVEDVHLGLESLLVGDTTSVAAAYRRLRRRAEHLRALSRAS
jgi:hypothetical protein